MNGEQTARNRASRDAGALFCEPCNRHHFQGEGEPGCAHPGVKPCPERVPCPHTLGEHRGVKGDLGCSVDECPCNVLYAFVQSGADEIRFRQDFTGTDKIAGEERWQAFPLTVEFAGIGVDVGHNGTTDGETKEKHFIQIDASRFFRLAAAFVDCVRANAEERRLSDVRAIRSHKDAETWLKRVSLARAVEGILTLKTDARMGSQPIDNPGAVQGAARAPAASAPPSRLVRPIDAADDLYQELLAHFDGLQSGASLFYRAVVSIQQHMAAYRDARDRERRGDPSGLSSVMHDAHTHPRRPDPISLGEELDEPESDEK